MLNRRGFLSSALAGMAAVSTSVIAPGANASPGGQRVYPQDLELVTVTDTSIVLTWFTASVPAATGDTRAVASRSDSVVRIGTSPNALDRVVRGAENTAYHHVEVSDLTPGTTYYYRAESEGIAATPRVLPALDVNLIGQVVGGLRAGRFTSTDVASVLPNPSVGGQMPMSSGVVTTLQPPPGRHLLTVALSNDMHLGETESGLIASHLPVPFTSLPGATPYSDVMSAALLADVRRRGAQVLVVNGDLTAEAEPIDVRHAYERLSTFGPIVEDGDASGAVLTTRGNHDRPHVGSAYANCALVPGGNHHDCLTSSFQLPLQQMYTAHANGIRFIGLDTAMLDKAGGTINAGQFEAIENELLSTPTTPTLVFGHHPVTDVSANESIAGADFVLDRSSARRLEELYARTPGVFLHHSGHTHRNRRTASPLAPQVSFLEVAAIKEYPGGFTLVRIYEGGYMANFYKSSHESALEWSQTTSQQMFGWHPSVTAGSLADRNFVVKAALV